MLGADCNSSKVPLSETDYVRFSELIREIFDKASLYFGFERLDSMVDQDKSELRSLSMIHRLHIRGDSFPQHEWDLAEGIFSSFDTELNERFGFSVSDLRQSPNLVVKQLEANVENSGNEYRRANAEFRSTLSSFFNNHDNLDEESLKAFLLEEPPKVLLDRFKELQAIQTSMSEIFRVEANENLPETLLQALSARLGDNDKFVSFAKAPAWPTNESIINTKPLVVHEGKYYCFIPHLLTTNIMSIVESLIVDEGSQRSKLRYRDSRTNYLEAKCMEYLSDLLPTSKVFRNLYYETKEGTLGKRSETDGLIIFDRSLFIIEAKSGSLSPSARRGSLTRLKSDSAKLVGKPYDQAKRTSDFILSTDQSIFYYRNGEQAVKVAQADIDEIFLINVTLENLSHISTRLNSLRTLEKSVEYQWPWSVCLNDLRVISEILDSPSEFIVYLKRRIRANDFPDFYVVDELDFLMYFLSIGLYFEEGFLDGADAMFIDDLTSDLSLYYSNLEKGLPAEKPKLDIPAQLNDLVSEISATAIQGFSRVTTALLEISYESMESIVEYFNKIQFMTITDGQDHDFTLIFQKPISRGFTFMSTHSYSSDFWRKAERYCEAQKYIARCSEWFLITREQSSDGTRGLSFRVFKYVWEYDPDLDVAYQPMRDKRIELHLRTHKKIGRNDPCPCGSGLKYKKCCNK